MSASYASVTGEWTKHQRFLSDYRDKQKAYFYWQKKLRKVACRELTQTSEPRDIVPSGWMQLKPNQTQLTTDGLCIEINDYHITVNAQTDLELLKKVCLTLRSLG